MNEQEPQNAMDVMAQMEAQEPWMWDMPPGQPTPVAPPDVPVTPVPIRVETEVPA